MPDNDQNTSELPFLRDVLKEHYKPGTIMAFSAKDIEFSGSNQGVKRLSVKIVGTHSDGSKLYRYLNKAAQDT